MGKDNKKAATGKPVADERFAAVHFDPRFQRFPKANAKLEVDDRFKGMFDDPAFHVGSGLDKRGRQQKSKKKNEDMRRYYRMKDEDEWRKDKEGALEQGDDEEMNAKKGKEKALSVPEPAAASEEEATSSSSSDEDDPEKAAAQERWARMRGLSGPQESSDEEESDDDSDQAALSSESDDPEANAEIAKATAEWGVGALAANPQEKVLMLPDATPRLACVDLDWEHISATDILVALRSFVPGGGAIQRVTVYPSDYGLERMAAEAKSGPQGIWHRGKKERRQEKKEQGRKKGGKDDSDSDSDFDSEESEEESGEESEDEAADGEVNHDQLRLYERSKLRWYYAVVECDTAQTANALYEECDGMELMKTANLFDLRFIPDDQSFQGRQVRDTAETVPSDYEPPTFQTRALQHTNVELTWDKGDDTRRRTLNRKITADELKEDDFKAYLATDSEGPSEGEDEDDRGQGAGGKEDPEAIRERYRRLLLGGGTAGKGGKKSAKERVGVKDWDTTQKGQGKESGSSGDEGEGDSQGSEDEEDKNMEMEVTFVPGLEGLGERLLAKKRDKAAQAGETVWESYMRRRRQVVNILGLGDYTDYTKTEKKAEAKRMGKFNVESDDDDSDIEQESDKDDDMPAGVSEDPFFQQETDPFDDPFFKNGPGGVGLDGTVANDGNNGSAAAAASKKGTSKKGKKSGAKGDEQDDADARRRRAELEMLLLDEDAMLKASKSAKNNTAGAVAGVKLSKKERMRLKKAQRRAERQGESDEEDQDAAAGAGFKVNLEDPRFKDLFGSHDFALDPTDPRFAKAGPAAAEVATAVAKRRSATGPASGGRKKDGEGGGSGAAVAAKVGGKADLSLMVASLKRKAAAVEGRKESGKGGGAGDTRGSKHKAKKI